jgi:2-polyprenyl-3-methyl-5-hydroxy-6-metoxy-1,4-benzoquinol methylase
MSLRAMWRQRRARASIYSSAAYWDSKAEQLEGAAVSMWPNNQLNALYEAEQVRHLDGALGDVAGRDILDIGCGTGRISRHLARRGARVVGFDFSAAAVEIARREPGPEIEYRTLSVFDLDERERYDAAVAWGTLTVAARDAAQLADALRRIRAALRPDAQIVLLEPIHSSFLARVLRLDVSAFTAVLEACGFKVERVEQLHFWPARFALAFFDLPARPTAFGYHVGQAMMRVPGLRRTGDYKAIIGRAV